MNLPDGFTLHLITPPGMAADAGRFGLTLAHMAYRVGGGPHLFCSQHPFSQRGGLMVMDHQGFDGRGSPEELCKEILRECAGRGFTGVFCDFEGPAWPVLRKAVDSLVPVMKQRGWRLYVPETYAGPGADGPCVVIPTAISGGSLRQRLTEAAEKYGPERLALGLERTAEDFTLPASHGSGRPLSREALKTLLVERSPAVYFSDELCAHYFTYMRPSGDAHFILYDDASSMVKKLHVANTLGIREAFLPYAQNDDLLQTLLK